jgi:hypothetical protein
MNNESFDIGCLDCKQKVWTCKNSVLSFAPEFIRRVEQFLLAHKGAITWLSPTRRCRNSITARM